MVLGKQRGMIWFKNTSIKNAYYNKRSRFIITSLIKYFQAQIAFGLGTENVSFDLISINEVVRPLDKPGVNPVQ